MSKFNVGDYVYTPEGDRCMIVELFEDENQAYVSYLSDRGGSLFYDLDDLSYTQISNRQSVKIDYIPYYNSRNLKCYFCGAEKSVKYKVTDPSINKAIESVYACNKCVLRYPLKNQVKDNGTT